MNIQLKKHKDFPTRSEKFNYLFLLLNKRSQIIITAQNADSLKLNYKLAAADKYNSEIQQMSYKTTEELKTIAETAKDPYKIYFACASMYFQWNLRKANEFAYYQKIYDRLKAINPRNK